MDTKNPEALAQECADYATSLRSTVNVVKLEGRSPPISFLRAADLFERAAARIADLEALAAGYAAARLEIESLQAQLESTGVDAYSYACDLMEQYQSKRGAEGKEVGTEGSLCDGIAWLYGHIAELEAQLEAVGEVQAQPVAWAVFAPNGNCRMWTQNKSHAEAAAKDTGLPLTALYTAPQPAAQALDDGCPHGSKHIVNDCMRCGAPVCCGKCCAEDAQALDARDDVATLLRKYQKLCVEIGRGDSYHLARIAAAIEAQQGGR